MRYNLIDPYNSGRHSVFAFFAAQIDPLYLAWPVKIIQVARETILPPLYLVDTSVLGFRPRISSAAIHRLPYYLKRANPPDIDLFSWRAMGGSACRCCGRGLGGSPLHTISRKDAPASHPSKPGGPSKCGWLSHKDERSPWVNFHRLHKEL